jgi:hypothetical protein
MGLEWLMALPTVTGALQAMFNRPQPVQPMMTWEQAMAAAQQQMQPALQQFDANSMQRGFYGQMPENAYRNTWAAGQQTQIANQMMRDAADMSLKQGQLNQDIRLNNMAGMMNGLNGSWGAINTYANLTGNLPTFMGGGQTPAMKSAVAGTVFPSMISGSGGAPRISNGGITPGIDALRNDRSVVFQLPWQNR